MRGSSPGTRETDLLSPHNAIEQVHGVLLAGGSAFGLDAAGGVMRWLEEHRIGVQVGPVRVPIVPAAILFDLWLGDAAIRPDAQAGYLACQAASIDAVAQGSVGAGAGATVGKLFGIERAMKGGIGSASVACGRHHGRRAGRRRMRSATSSIVERPRDRRRAHRGRPSTCSARSALDAARHGADAAAAGHARPASA